MSHQYQRPVSTGGLRLHLNENTAGCSPRVMDVLRALTRQDAALYPDYDRAWNAAASRFRVAPDNLLLTNGLDEGILLGAMVALRGTAADDPFEAVIVQPAFDMYAACADAVGGRIIDVLPPSDFFFSVQSVSEAVTAKTRVIFLANPNNPTGLSIDPDVVAAVARAAPHALVFLDEAYADFSDQTMIDQAASGEVPNLIVGRTFAKAYGLAGLRVGALVGTRENLAPMRRAIPPYSLNAFAAAALPAAVEDDEYYDWYLAEVQASKKLLYDVLARKSVRFWPSDGNFVLACFGQGLGSIIEELATRGIIIRDRSKDPGCEGCARITAGVVEHTRRVVAALEEVLCAAQQ
jgi:histidinol-phosphate aminotransferase